MQNFRAIAALDTFDLIPSVRARLSLFRPGERGERVIHLRWPEGEAWKRSREWGKWAELQNTIGRIQRVGEQIVGKVERGRIFLEMLDPGGILQWRTEEGPYYENFLRVHLPIRTNPAAVIWSGAEFSHLPAGQLTLVNVRAPSSAVNMGEYSRVHLICDFRPVTAKTEEERA